MKNIKNNANFLKKILLIVVFAVLFITSLVMFIQSVALYDDGYGTDYSANTDFIVVMLVSVIFIAFSIYNLVSKKDKYPAKILSLGVSFTLISFYSLGIFFKKLAKAISKGKEFGYIENQVYLYAGIIGLIVICAVVFDYFDHKNTAK